MNQNVAVRGQRGYVAGVGCVATNHHLRRGIRKMGDCKVAR